MEGMKLKNQSHLGHTSQRIMKHNRDIDRKLKRLYQHIFKTHSDLYIMSRTLSPENFRYHEGGQALACGNTTVMWWGSRVELNMTSFILFLFFVFQLKIAFLMQYSLRIFFHPPTPLRSSQSPLQSKLISFLSPHRKQAGI